MPKYSEQELQYSLELGEEISREEQASDDDRLYKGGARCRPDRSCSCQSPV